MTLRQPKSRDDVDWKKTQGLYIEEVAHVQEYIDDKLYSNVYYDLASTRGIAPTPVLISGDIFNVPDESSECTAFALSYLSGIDGVVHTIPGQHDLPYHNYQDIDKSAYGILTRYGKRIKDCDGMGLLTSTVDKKDKLRDIFICTFPYGCNIVERLNYYEESIALNKKEKKMTIGMVHYYCGMEGRTYDAKETKLNNVETIRKLFKDFNVVCFGDNHKHFIYNGDQKKKGPVIYNGGSFIPRNSDEKGNRSYIGIIYNTGRVQALPMESNKKDKWKKGIGKIEKEIPNESLVDSIRKAQNLSIQTREAFLEMVTQLKQVRQCSPIVRRIIKGIIKQVEDE